jgi:hypothetical protein
MSSLVIAVVLLFTLIFWCCSSMSGYADQTYKIGGSNYTRKAGLDFAGNDLAYAKPLNRTQCGIWCNSHPNCKGFGRGLKGNECFLKTQMSGNGSPNSGRNSFIKM